MVEARDSKLSSHWWWFEAENNTYKNRSPWLQSTLAELDRKTNAMLRIIEGDADSFAQRAEMFYKKRPELISMVRDYYRAHCLLAEGYSETFDLEESDLSEVDDPEPEEVKKEDSHSVCIGEALKLREEIERMKEEARALKDMKRDEIDNGEVAKLKEEMERLKEENRIQKEVLVQKDEEKREAIRQLSLAMDLLREENKSLRNRIPSNVGTRNSHQSPKSKVPIPKEAFWRRFFSGPPKAEVSLVTF
ncbi:PREDICTED: protein NETWORKED 3A-like isoform X2 [Ipomoea nil]|uniref:protein NETWORKED 3A-like isoform X2 n=1 Tax=Ipomoea nil TaxID=35883 RepID=UPI0009016ACD|nr:PREDICTED: protein NETWORKED 3A-like isoform X2 [Ipomoea nil]